MSTNGTNNLIIDFFKKYEFCLSIKDEFPKYLKKKMETLFNSLKLQSEKEIPIKYISKGEDNTFYLYLKEMELKYFSKLIPRPLSLILKHNLTQEEKDLFNADFFHVFNFTFTGKKNLKINIADNFKEVNRAWTKGL